MDSSNNEIPPKVRPKLENFKDLEVLFKYSFYSGIWIDDKEPFIKDVSIDIILESLSAHVSENVGRVDFSVLNMGQAAKMKRDLFDGRRWHSSVSEKVKTKVLAPSNNDFSIKVKSHYRSHLFRTNLHRRGICIIDDISIFPPFRGYHVALKAVKDIIENYSDTCSLFVLEPYPHKPHPKFIDPDTIALELDKFERTGDEAIEKLSNYFKKIGFEEIKGIDGLLFLNPTIPNKKLDAIDLDKIPAFGTEYPELVNVDGRLEL